MRIDVRAIHLDLSEPLLQYVIGHLGQALDCHQRRVESVHVRLSDENGHKRRGPDKCCQVRVGVRGRSPVFINEHGSDVYAAVDGAAQRAKRAVRQEINRRRDVRRRQHATLAA